MDLILLFFGVPILLLLLCGWAQWFLVSHKDRAPLALPLLTGALAVLCFCKASTVGGWDSLAWGLLYLPWSCAALLGTLIGWPLGRWSKKRKRKSELTQPDGEEKNDE